MIMSAFAIVLGIVAVLVPVGAVYPGMPMAHAAAALLCQLFGLACVFGGLFGVFRAMEGGE